MRGYIFDMDGTLFQTNLILTPALEETFQMLRDKGLWEGETPLERYEAIMVYLYQKYGERSVHYILNYNTK